MAIGIVLLSALGAFLLYRGLATYNGLRRNIAEAKKSGLPYVITPIYVYHKLWLATKDIWLPLLRKLPKSFHGLWLTLADSEWAYRVGYGPFEELGADAFLLVSPFSLNAFVASAEVITQITTRRNDFPKPLRLYKRMDIYGKNLLTTEGQAWRMHRRLTAPSFGEKNNEVVFKESVHHAQALANLWAGETGSGNATIADPAQDTTRFALYIISRAGFDVRVLWPHEEGDDLKDTNAQGNSVIASSVPPPGHKMDYREALSSLLENIMWSQVMPPAWLLKSPVKVHREVGLAIIEWGKYMSEIFESKKEEVAHGHKDNDGMDLFQALIRNSGILDPKKNSEFQKSDLLGNAFVLMLAGHETTANALHYSVLFLAMNPQVQRHLQADLDKAFGNKPIQEWDYEQDFPKLFDGMAAAVMNETLRLTQPIINIPKCTEPGRPMSVNMDGKEYTIPGGTHISLCSAVHRNPKYWPPTPGYTSPPPPGRSEAECWRPERWLATHTTKQNTKADAYDDEALRGPSGEDTSAHLFKPVKGSYIPFSDGYRSCIGRRFAQVELLAALAVIYSQWSIELAVDDWASDEEVEKMPKGGEERKKVWRKARDQADRYLREKMKSIITLQMRGVSVPIRLVRRGEERFGFSGEVV
ncbi:cytochrome P450 monooxygenase-like protein [Sporormia fimetaria CBS 119925]|uniref:Cytochrome P450 monooxygenase-like protein n=1 Tax=Sporormia fimetaria CBS 119925 TaxID=1340428 RepID=A0A6A6V968_9PLEO|nr:cytochrome P450 monooxygenase-like protein [Sporormia fimetaria CBS 119925]